MLTTVNNALLYSTCTSQWCKRVNMKSKDSYSTEYFFYKDYGGKLSCYVVGLIVLNLRVVVLQTWVQFPVKVKL